MLDPDLHFKMDTACNMDNYLSHRKEGWHKKNQPASAPSPPTINGLISGPDSQSPTQLTIHKKYLLVDGSEAQQ